MLERARMLVLDGRVQDTAAVLFADATSVTLRHATELKALEDFIIFCLTVAFLVWRWKKESKN